MPDTRQYDAASPGTGKSHLATAFAVEAVRAGKLVYFIPLADLIAQLAKAEREGTPCGPHPIEPHGGRD